MSLTSTYVRDGYILIVHRRRIELEDKVKVVASGLGDRILAALAVLPRCKDSVPQSDAMTFTLSSNSILLLYVLYSSVV